MVRPMVHSTKHIVQQSITTVTGGGVVTVNVAESVAVGAKNLVFEVEEGSSIKAVYVEMWERSSSTTPSSGQAIFYKKIADASSATAADMAALGDWDNKKNILYTTMGLFNDQDADAVNLIRGWIKIPKGKQRMGLGDKIQMTFFASVVDTVICGFFLYKEYT